MHKIIENFVFEALVEHILVSKYCLDYKKNPLTWGRPGCYGFPASVLLFSIADTIGSFVVGGESTRKHFEIFNHKDYYNLNLTENDVDEMYKMYRCKLTHNSVLPRGRIMDIGEKTGVVFENEKDGKVILNLLPFWIKSYYCVKKFLENESFENNTLAKSILEIPYPSCK